MASRAYTRAELRALAGVVLLAAARPLSTLMGLPGPSVARVVGAALVIFAAALLYNAARATVSRVEAVAAMVLNAGWVLDSALVVLAGPLTLIGNLAVAAVAAAVLLFTMLEVVGRARLREPAGWRGGGSRVAGGAMIRPHGGSDGRHRGTHRADRGCERARRCAGRLR
jgi:hypothetical protein